MADLQRWVGQCRHHKENRDDFPKISEGSEHLVHLDAHKALVYKVTRTGLFGESYYLDEGRMAQRNCSPVDYLIRLRLWEHVFDSAPKPLEITSGGQVVSYHHFITGTLPDQEEVNVFLERAGFRAVRRQFWLWEKDYPDEEFTIGLGDARDENFVKSALGIVPIDVRLWFC